MKNDKIILAILLTVCAHWSCAQVKKSGGHDPQPLVPSQLVLTRESCECGGYSGNRYRIAYDALSSPENAGCSYSIAPVLRAADSLKIRILSELLSVTDTSLSCRPVRRYGSAALPSPTAKRYSLQIDALFTFNFIAFGVDTKKYAPYPVLYDTITGREISNDAQKVSEVMEIYKSWLREVSRRGFKNYTFPLIETRYRWYGGITDKRIYNGLPDHPKADNLGVPYLN